MLEQRRISDVLNSDEFTFEDHRQEYSGNTFFVIKSKSEKKPEIKISVKGKYRQGTSFHFVRAYDAFYLSVEIDGKEVFQKDLKDGSFKKLTREEFVNSEFEEYFSFTELIKQQSTSNVNIDRLDEVMQLDSALGLSQTSYGEFIVENGKEVQDQAIDEQKNRRLSDELSFRELTKEEIQDIYSDEEQFTFTSEEPKLKWWQKLTNFFYDNEGNREEYVRQIIEPIKKEREQQIKKEVAQFVKLFQAKTEGKKLTELEEQTLNIFQQNLYQLITQCKDNSELSYSFGFPQIAQEEYSLYVSEFEQCGFKLDEEIIERRQERKKSTKQKLTSYTSGSNPYINLKAIIPTALLAMSGFSSLITTQTTTGSAILPFSTALIPYKHTGYINSDWQINPALSQFFKNTRSQTSLQIQLFIIDENGFNYLISPGSYTLSATQQIDYQDSLPELTMNDDVKAPEVSMPISITTKLLKDGTDIPNREMSVSLMRTPFNTDPIQTVRPLLITLPEPTITPDVLETGSQQLTPTSPLKEENSLTIEKNQLDGIDIYPISQEQSETVIEEKQQQETSTSKDEEEQTTSPTSIKLEQHLEEPHVSSTLIGEVASLSDSVHNSTSEIIQQPLQIDSADGNTTLLPIEKEDELLSTRNPESKKNQFIPGIKTMTAGATLLATGLLTKCCSKKTKEDSKVSTTSNPEITTKTIDKSSSDTKDKHSDTKTTPIKSPDDVAHSTISKNADKTETEQKVPSFDTSLSDKDGKDSKTPSFPVYKLENYDAIAEDIIKKSRISEEERKGDIKEKAKTIFGRSELYAETRTQGIDIECFERLEDTTRRALILAKTAQNGLDLPTTANKINQDEATRIALGKSAQTEIEAKTHISCMPDEIRYPKGKENVEAPFACSSSLDRNGKTILKIDVLDPTLYKLNQTKKVQESYKLALEEGQVFYDVLRQIQEDGLQNFVNQLKSDAKKHTR